MSLRFITNFAACAYIVASTCLLTAHAQRVQRIQRAPPSTINPTKLKLVFANGTVTLNGRKLALPIERKELVGLLGKPSREVPAANILLIWDELGLLAYQRPKTQKIRSLQITLDQEAIQVRPNKLFAGQVQVEGATITARSTPESINRAIKPRAFVKDPGLSHLLGVGHWKMEYTDCVLFLREADPAIKSAKAHISSLSLDRKDDE
jgi:hypothetical protein